nr:uncharacterized protein LOC115138218 isoform X3 [Oncorhynchus nerka]
MASEDPQDQLDEAIKKAERLAKELNQEKDPQAQLDEAINEAKRLAEELNPERENKKKKTNKPPGIRFRWRQRLERGQIVPQTRKATTSTSLAPRASTSRARLVQHFVPVTEEEESETMTSGLESTPVLNIDEEIGRYNVTVPVLTCTTCLTTWTANLADLIKNGRWPATVNCDTIYQNGMTCGDTFQKSFFEWMYCHSEIDQVCDIQYFDCPACSPGMLAVSVDGNKKLYRFKKGQQQKSRRRPRLSNFKSDLGVGDETVQLDNGSSAMG